VHQEPIDKTVPRLRSDPEIEEALLKNHLVIEPVRKGNIPALRKDLLNGFLFKQTLEVDLSREVLEPGEVMSVTHPYLESLCGSQLF
jgi:hypothetical protein